jgi:hypothetical protein
MKLKEVKQLHRGDEVYWNDPDNGLCSKVIQILTIRVNGNVVQIIGMDAAYLECYAHELSANKPDEVAFSC